MSGAPKRADDNYIFGPGHSPAFNAEMVLAFAQLVTHGNGGSFRLTRAALRELGEVKITRVHDEATGDIIFSVEGILQ